MGVENLNKILLSSLVGGLLGFGIAPLIHESIKRGNVPDPNLSRTIPSNPRESTKEPNVDSQERSQEPGGPILASSLCRPMHLKTDNHGQEQLKEIYANCDVMILGHIDGSSKVAMTYDCRSKRGDLPIDEDCTRRYEPLIGTLGNYVNSKVLNDGWRVFSSKRLRDSSCGTSYIGRLTFTRECLTAYMLVRPLR